jgi:hypothetical protein
MRIVLGGLDGVTFYFDNILIYSKTWSEHLLRVESVLRKLLEFGLTAKPGKCKFGFKNLDYLGFVISGDTICPQNIKIDKILHAEIPATKKALRSFLGLVSFYRKFIPNLSSLTSSLSDKLKKGISEPLEYSVEDLASFRKLKSFLVSAPVLKVPDLSKHFVVRSDSSNTGLGAVLLQYVENIPHPVAYASRKLNSAELNYATIEKECLAIVFAIIKFSMYLLGKPFILETDHRPLVYLSKMKNLNTRLARWAILLQPYKFNIVYIPGVENVGADFMSRSLSS